ncbi:unnamed protein product [Closterium sp. Naga37s-1]|nr:unnamed protein product [Closterium sp. Naga37s-1]
MFVAQREVVCGTTWWDDARPAATGIWLPPTRPADHPLAGGSRGEADGARMERTKLVFAHACALPTCTLGLGSVRVCLGGDPLIGVGFPSRWLSLSLLRSGAASKCVPGCTLFPVTPLSAFEALLISTPLFINAGCECNAYGRLLWMCTQEGVERGGRGGITTGSTRGAHNPPPLFPSLALGGSGARRATMQHGGEHERRTQSLLSPSFPHPRCTEGVERRGRQGSTASSTRGAHNPPSLLPSPSLGARREEGEEAAPQAAREARTTPFSPSFPVPRCTREGVERGGRGGFYPVLQQGTVGAEVLGGARWGMEQQLPPATTATSNYCFQKGCAAWRIGELVGTAAAWEARQQRPHLLGRAEGGGLEHGRGWSYDCHQQPLLSEGKRSMADWRAGGAAGAWKVRQH